MQTFTILGSNPELSLLEIKGLTGADPVFSTNLVAVFDDINVELTKLNDKLGGIQKIGHIVGSIKRESRTELVDFLTSMIIGANYDGKIIFGISIYEFGDPKRARALQKDKDAIGLEIKKVLKASGQPVRYVTNRDPNLSAVTVTKNKMLESGGEFVFLVREREILIGLTSAVQDYEDWSKRDFDRPRRDAKRGMLPPKLARMLINITGVEAEGKTLLDPFCGSGTVLMEGAMLGFEKLYGSDILEMAVTDTEQNLGWLKNAGYDVPVYKLYTTTAANIGAYIEPESVDAIATEPFLGVPRQGSETFSQVSTAINELEALYTNCFSALYKTLKPGGVVVLVNPVHFVKEVARTGDTRNLEQKEHAFEVPMNAVMRKIGFNTDPEYNNDILYRREGQFVGRRVMKFIKK